MYHYSSGYWNTNTETETTTTEYIYDDEGRVVKSIVTVTRTVKSRPNTYQVTYNH